jgi:hypothetical protein
MDDQPAQWTATDNDNFNADGTDDFEELSDDEVSDLLLSKLEKLGF